MYVYMYVYMYLLSKTLSRLGSCENLVVTLRIEGLSMYTS